MNMPVSHPAFEHIRSEHIRSLDIDLHEFRHIDTGTPHVHLAADNPENVFLVGLRTIPTDSTGVAHILEHTVLCGSEKYPVRDPFFMMIRRSLNTFMNAFTSSDWTAYPFASQNRKDFFNLLDVYLDAVFFSRLHELDFAQEGHRVEFEKPDDPSSPLVFKGVVFNEMKGAMSAPTSFLWQTLTKHLFPNNTYHHNSGGDPEAIPDLSYQQLKNFYDTHYHPSNAVLMTYGDIPAQELQARFQLQVLSRFKPLDRTISVADAKRYHSPVRVEEAYATQETETGDKTHIVVGWLLGSSVDLDQRLRAHLLSSVLLDNSASPLMQALEKSDLGTSPSPLCGLEDSAKEMVFACGLEGSNPEQTEAVESLILDTLADVVSNGVPQSQIEAVLHQLELSQREIRGDGMPFGLQLVLSGLSTAMQRGDTLASIDLDPALERLRKDAADPKFIKSLVQDLLSDNVHRVTLTLRPDQKISERRDLAEAARLATLQKSLDETQKAEIVEQAKALAERQVQEDDPEILPKVTLADVPAELRIPQATNQQIAAAPATLYAQGTNGIVYPHVIIQLPQLSSELKSLLPFYNGFLAELGSGGRDYLATQAHQAAVSGGIGAYALQRGSIDNEQDVSGYLIIRGKALMRNVDAMSQLLLDTVSNVRFDEYPRLRELVSQSRASREQSVTGSGHVLAMMAAASGMSPTSQNAHQMTGLAGIKSLKTFDDSLRDDSTLKAVGEQLAEIHEIIANAPRQFMVVAEQENMKNVASSLNNAFKHLGSASEFDGYKPEAIRKQVGEIWTTSTEVNFCALAFPTVTASHKDAAALSVLGPFLRNGYLHRTIRETGGAYGGGASHDADTASFRFYSYRDPRLTETLKDFNRSVEWLLAEKHDERLLEEAILNVVSGIDKPGSPAGEARNAFQANLFGRTAEQRRSFRERILKVSLDDLIRVGDTYLNQGQASTGIVTSEKNALQDDVKELGLVQIPL